MPTLALRDVPQLRPDQARIAWALDEYDVVVAAMGRRWGKTVLGLVLVLAALLNGMRVAWVVPTYRNSNPLWRAIRAAIAPLVRSGRAQVNKAERYVEMWNGGFLGIYSADSADAIRGEWFHLVMIDEAARVSEEVVEDVIQPTVADVGGKIVAISTPKGKNWFWRAWRDGKERSNGTISFEAPTSDNPNPRIRRAAELASERLPERSFAQEWLAQFIEDGALVWLREWAESHRYDPTDEQMTQQVIARWLSYDTAAKDKDHNAYSSCAVGELLPDYRMRLRHVWRDRLLFPNLVEVVENDITKWDADGKLHGVIIEDKSSGTSLYQTLMAAGSERLQQMLIAYMPTASKDQRFDQAGVWVKNGSFIIPFPDPSVRWLHAWEAEIFEEDEYKDQRDATAQLILYNEPRVFHVRQERLREIGRAA